MKKYGGVIFLGFVLALVAPVDFGRSTRASQSDSQIPYGFENEIAGIETSQAAEIFSFEIPSDAETALVVEVIDGDTAVLDSGWQVRLIGINAPEIGQPYAPEATDFLASLVLGKKVSMAGDVTDIDQYDRLLRYLYFDGKFINLEVVRAGFAVFFPYAPDLKHSDLFGRAELEASSVKLGLWKF